MKLLLAPVSINVTTCSISLTFVKSTITLLSLTFDVVTVQTFPSLIIVADLEGVVLRLGSLKEADCYCLIFRVPICLNAIGYYLFTVFGSLPTHAIAVTWF
jgi:hypothetical protein